MSKASLGQSECESTVGDANKPVEPYIPTYAEMIRREYGDELHENIYMHSKRDLEAARRAYKENTQAEEENAKPAYFCEICGKPVREDIAERSKQANGGHVYCSGKCRDMRPIDTSGGN